MKANSGTRTDVKLAPNWIFVPHPQSYHLVACHQHLNKTIVARGCARQLQGGYPFRRTDM